MGSVIDIDKSGRLVLPKETRDRYGLGENSRLIVRENKGEITLIPVKRYTDPVESLYGSVPVDKPVDDPKMIARNYIRKRFEESL